MKRIYRVPIMGGVEDDKPLKGVSGNPLCPIPLHELPGLPEDETLPGYTSLDYNVDEGWVEIELDANEVVHNWLSALIPRLENIAKSQGWKLDKTKLEKTRAAREQE